MMTCWTDLEAIAEEQVSSNKLSILQRRSHRVWQWQFSSMTLCDSSLISAMKGPSSNLLSPLIETVLYRGFGRFQGFCDWRNPLCDLTPKSSDLSLFSALVDVVLVLVLKKAGLITQALTDVWRAAYHYARDPFLSVSRMTSQKRIQSHTCIHIGPVTCRSLTFTLCLLHVFFCFCIFHRIVLIWSES